MKVLTIGGATQDVFLTYAGTDYMTIAKQGALTSYLLFESGEKVEIEDITYKTGGGATNSATGFKRLGFETSCLCNIKNDEAGKAVRLDLENEAVETSHIHISQQNPTGISFIINSAQGERTIFAYRGANSLLREEDIPYDVIKNCDQLYITSLSNEASKLLPAIVTYAYKYKVPVAINPGISQLAKGTETLKECLKYIDTLILNSYEAKNFMIALIERDKSYKKALESLPEKARCKTNETDEKPYLINTPILYENLYFSIRKFFQQALAMGPKIVVITNGCNGVYVATENKILFHPSLKIPVVDTVGAGDSFGSCFIASLKLKYSIQDALRNGIINSASVLGHVGAKTGLLTHEQLKEKRKELDTKLLQEFELQEK
ncbi:MAG: carbohydrate kinase family protein [bacterium]